MMRARSGIGVSFGTFGELLQGAVEPGQDFLVTLPIARWSTARVTLTPDVTELRVHPQAKSKALRVAHAVLARHGVSLGGSLVLSSELPEGKGMSSSSADLVATVRAVGDAVGIPPTPEQTESFLREVEPTDGLMYRDVVAFHHREVRLRRVLGPVPPLTIVGVDEGGQVDTVDFNASRPVIAPAHRREYHVLLDELEAALATGDVTGVGRVATRSAELNQERCHKRHLDRMSEISRDVGGLGVVVAHSGTMVGIVLSGTDSRLADKVEETVAACAGLGPVSVDRTLDAVGVPALIRTTGTERESYVD
jgi:uncharacterized protein involved in propanediol utilization